MALLPQKFVVAAFGIGATALLALIIRRRVSLELGPWLLLSLALVIPVVEFSHYVMSEVPFLFFLAAAVVACDRLERTPEGSIPIWTGLLRDRRLVLLALTVAAAAYTRAAGLAVAAGALLWLLLGRRPRQAAALGILLAVLALPWVVQMLTTPGGSPYLHQLALVNPHQPEQGHLGLGSWLARIGSNARACFLKLIPITVLPWWYSSTYSPPEVQDRSYPVLLALLLLLPLAGGIWRALRRNDPAVAILAIGLALLLLWSPAGPVAPCSFSCSSSEPGTSCSTHGRRASTRSGGATTSLPWNGPAATPRTKRSSSIESPASSTSSRNARPGPSRRSGIRTGWRRASDATE